MDEGRADEAASERQEQGRPLVGTVLPPGRWAAGAEERECVKGESRPARRVCSVEEVRNGRALLPSVSASAAWGGGGGCVWRLRLDNYDCKCAFISALVPLAAASDLNCATACKAVAQLLLWWERKRGHARGDKCWQMLAEDLGMGPLGLASISSIQPAGPLGCENITAKSEQPL
ncbi:hypothetical protein ANO11243_073000 [Dothideomycetidae sp. 11243]|nr:hypothetical protein ANO11243_073000 [fungal sp. No.11243]